MQVVHPHDMGFADSSKLGNAALHADIGVFRYARVIRLCSQITAVEYGSMQREVENRAYQFESAA